MAGRRYSELLETRVNFMSLTLRQITTLVISFLIVITCSEKAIEEFENIESVHDNGTPDFVTVWEENIETGRLVKCRNYFPDGNLKQEFEVQNISGLTKRHGQFTMYYSNGYIQASGTLNNDRMDGIWYSYADDGSLEKQCDFKNDVPQSVREFLNGRWIDSTNDKAIRIVFDSIE